MDRTQRTFRFPVQLDREFRAYLKKTGANANTVVQELVAELLEKRYGANLEPKELRLLQRLWGSMPIAGAIKEVHGRVIFGTPEFRRLINREEVTGALATDYFSEAPETALRIMAHERAVVEQQKPLLCLDTIPIKGEMRARLAIRFPIFDRTHQWVEMTGVIGFDLAMIERMTNDVAPGNPQPFEWPPEGFVWPTSSSEQAELPDSLLRAFIYNIPAILTVKASDSHKLLCVNADYTRVTGRQRSEVLGKRPTENWNGEVGQLIEACDDKVRKKGRPLMSVESLEVGGREIQRLNIRFPVWEWPKPSEDPKFSNIGTIGFDYQLLKKGIELLREMSKSSQIYAFVLSENPDSMRQLPIHV